MAARRMSVNLSAAAVAALDHIQTDHGIPTTTEAISHAVQVYAILLDHQLAGGTVVLRDAAGLTERLRVV